MISIVLFLQAEDANETERQTRVVIEWCVVSIFSFTFFIYPKL